MLVKYLRGDSTSRVSPSLPRVNFEYPRHITWRTNPRNSLDKESRIQLAVSDYKKSNLTSIKEAVHGVAYGTVRDRLNGLQTKCHTIPRTRKLSVDQESALVKYILNLNSRGFPPKPRYVREMANALLAQDGNGKVGKNWVSSFCKAPRRTQVYVHAQV
jgi:hypothetical protein